MNAFQKIFNFNRKNNNSSISTPANNISNMEFNPVSSSTAYNPVSYTMGGKGKIHSISLVDHGRHVCSTTQGNPEALKNELIKIESGLIIDEREELLTQKEQEEQYQKLKGQLEDETREKKSAFEKLKNVVIPEFERSISNLKKEIQDLENEGLGKVNSQTKFRKYWYLVMGILAIIFAFFFYNAAVYSGFVFDPISNASSGSASTAEFFTVLSFEGLYHFNFHYLAFLGILLLVTILSALKKNYGNKGLIIGSLIGLLMDIVIAWNIHEKHNEFLGLTSQTPKPLLEDSNFYVVIFWSLIIQFGLVFCLLNFEKELDQSNLWDPIRSKQNFIKDKIAELEEQLKNAKLELVSAENDYLSKKGELETLKINSITIPISKADILRRATNFREGWLYMESNLTHERKDEFSMETKKIMEEFTKKFEL